MLLYWMFDGWLDLLKLLLRLFGPTEIHTKDVLIKYIYYYYYYES
jgi:hypothetical protein